MNQRPPAEAVAHEQHPIPDEQIQHAPLAVGRPEVVIGRHRHGTIDSFDYQEPAFGADRDSQPCSGCPPEPGHHEPVHDASTITNGAHPIQEVLVSAGKYVGGSRVSAPPNRTFRPGRAGRAL